MELALSVIGRLARRSKLPKTAGLSGWNQGEIMGAFATPRLVIFFEGICRTAVARPDVFPALSLQNTSRRGGIDLRFVSRSSHRLILRRFHRGVTPPIVSCTTLANISLQVTVCKPLN